MKGKDIVIFFFFYFRRKERMGRKGKCYFIEVRNRRNRLYESCDMMYLVIFLFR